ncbi:MAG: magnesium transporter [Patescibacteria group bacterium]|nr:magnesium transporter [Patescibacteria group bacterium]
MNKNLIKNLPKDAAGRLMNDRVPIAGPSTTMAEVTKYLLANVKQLESISYVYVVGKSGKLLGVMSIKEIFRQPKNKKASQVMIKDLVTASPHTDREKVALASLKHSVKMVPVVDKKGIFLGAVLNDAILDILYQEAQEDISYFVGVDKEHMALRSILQTSIFQSVRARLPWLLVGLLGGILAAEIINLFEGTLAKNIILASFIPLIVYISNAVGAQVGFLFVRDIAVNSKLKFNLYFLRQSSVILIIAALISFLMLLITIIFYKDLLMGIVLSLAMFAAILTSIATGLFLPYALNRMKFDPANATGPIGTIIQDILSVLVYLWIAKLML